MFIPRHGEIDHTPINFTTRHKHLFKLLIPFIYLYLLHLNRLLLFSVRKKMDCLPYGHWTSETGFCNFYCRNIWTPCTHLYGIHYTGYTHTRWKYVSISDPGVIRTTNLSIRSQTRYRCATHRRPLKVAISSKYDKYQKK